MIIGKEERESCLLGWLTQAGSLGRIQMGSIESKVRRRRVEREERAVELYLGLPGVHGMNNSDLTKE